MNFHIKNWKKHKKFLNSSGSVLIEFACVIPVFMMLIYYMSDLSVLNRVKLRAQNVADNFGYMMLHLNNNSVQLITEKQLSDIARSIGISLTGTTNVTSKSEDKVFDIDIVLTCIGNCYAGGDVEWQIVFNVFNGYDDAKSSYYHLKSLKYALSKVPKNGLYVKKSINELRVYQEGIAIIVEVFINAKNNNVFSYITNIINKNLGYGRSIVYFLGKKRFNKSKIPQ